LKFTEGSVISECVGLALRDREREKREGEERGKRYRKEDGIEERGRKQGKLYGRREGGEIS
jgi:hypothetical protein